MQQNFRTITNLLILIFSLAAWWFVARTINPELHYFLQQSAFLTDSQFFQSFVRYPGGIADYLSEFIAQFFYYRIFGSFLIILVASLLGIIAIRLVQRVQGQVKLNLTIFFLILMLSVLIQCNYYYPFYASIRLLLAFGFVWLFTELIVLFHRVRFFTGFLLATLLFYLAGGAALFAFAVSAILIQLRFSTNKNDYLILPLFAVFCGFLPFLSYKYFFLVDLPLVYSITQSKSPAILFYTPDYKLVSLYSLLPVYLFFALIFFKLKNRPERPSSQAVQAESVKGPSKISVGKRMDKVGKVPSSESETVKKMWTSPVFILGGQLAVLLVLSVGSLNFTFDHEKKDKILVSFYGANGDWNNVIQTAESLPDYDPFVNFEFNKALANTGKLAENLFDYPQLAGSSGLFLDAAVTSDVPFVCSDQYYDLGFMHESEHWTFEAQTIFPNSPRLMKRLVQINLVIGKYKLAEKFLDRLDENILYRDWVADHRKYISDTSLVSKDPVFSWKRKCEPKKSFTAKSYVEKLTKLLDANPANRMAYDYLASSTLLDGDLGTFESLVSENKIFPKYPMPRAWEEAYVLYTYVSGKSSKADSYQLSQSRQKQFVSFIKAMKPFGDDWQQAKQSLQKEYGTTFWFYVKCLNPRVTKAQIKRKKSND